MPSDCTQQAFSSTLFCIPLLTTFFSTALTAAQPYNNLDSKIGREFLNLITTAPQTALGDISRTETTVSGTLSSPISTLITW
ncbi:hypothetical protein NADE_006851 [Nannochloris sp. 'desiccata']|nr:hypothetical protein NADE_006851 [Chlorella desiccata (nom. nud.)]